MNAIDELINNLHEAGMSGRKIAKQLGISKSAVNYRLNGRKGRGTGVKSSGGPKILLFDLESAPSLVATFGRWNVNIGPDSVVQEGGYIISACFKFLGDAKVTKLVQTSNEAVVGDDSRIVAELYEAFEQADIVVGHNAKRFDVPLFKTRLIANNMPPHKTVKVLDTLVIAKTLKFNSNKLDSLGNYLDVGRKIPTEGMTLWLGCMQGKRESLSKMLKYNEQDVLLLEKVYMQLRAFDTNPTNLGLYHNDEVARCPACGSKHLTPTGNSVYTSVSEFTEVCCDDCGHRSRSRQSFTTKEKRRNLLATPK